MHLTKIEKIDRLSDQKRSLYLDNNPDFKRVYDKYKLEIKEKYRRDNANEIYIKPMGAGAVSYKMSLGEIAISEALKKNKIPYIRKYEFSKLKSPVTGRGLRFDFYLREINACIEYDGGKRHGLPAHGYSVGLAYRKLRDDLKTEFCSKMGIRLIRITKKELSTIEQIIEPLSMLLSGFKKNTWKRRKDKRKKFPVNSLF